MPRCGFDFQDPVEPGQDEQQSTRDRQRAAGKPGARAARDHGDRIRATGSQHRLHLLDGLRQRDEIRNPPVRGECVALEGDAGSRVK